jgi:hypothetical protein
MGFTFDDSDQSGTTSSLARMHELINSDRRNAERIFEYIGGAELNTSPTQSHHRYVISFADLTQPEAELWPELMAIVREKVLPERSKLGGYSVAEKRSENWWQFGTYAAALQAAISGQPRCLAISRVATHHAISFQPTTRVFADSIAVFPMATNAAFAAIQCRPHEVWARFLGSSMKDDLRYATSDCFETFPFPEHFETDARLEAVGKEYYEFRAALMVKNNEGLTKTYNRFHDPDERSPEILKLRELHAAMDRAVLDAYGWTDLKPTCEFLLDYEEEDDEDEAGSGRRRKKPWRYRWPDDFRDEVLARLLELNRHRAEEERLSGAAAEAGRGKARKKSTPGAKAATKKPDQPELFGS